MSESPSSLPVRTRFAPSPSGHLHVGGARTALFCRAYARGRGGKFVLRIEDTDQRRSSDAAVANICRDLYWLGLTWDEGPEFADCPGCGGGETGPYRQSERLDIYNAQIERMIAEGTAYYAFDTAEELDAQRQAARAAGRPYRYDRSALALSKAEVEARLARGEPAVVRFRAPEGPVTIVDEVLGETVVPAEEIDDFIIRKADGYPTYHFAVVVDDELMLITHVIRAQEHYKNTARHMLLQDALGFRRPVYAHLAVMTNLDGSKMSKRDKDKALRAAVKEHGLTGPPAGTIAPDLFAEWLADKDRQLEFEESQRLAEALGVHLPEINVDDFRRSGYLPSALCNFLALHGWNPGEDIEKFDMAFLEERFNFDRVQKASAKFDRAKLLSFNLDALAALPPEAFAAGLRAHGEANHSEFMRRFDAAQFDLFARINQSRSKTFDDPFIDGRFFIVPDESIEWPADEKSIRKAMTGGEPDGLTHLRHLLPTLEGLAEWTTEALEGAVNGYAAEHAEGKLGKVAQPLRIAVSGSTVSPAIFETLAILGRQSTLTRIRRCIAAFEARQQTAS